MNVYLSKIGAKTIKGAKPGKEVSENIFDEWANAHKNGNILIVGTPTPSPGEASFDFFVPIKTWVAKEYIEYTCGSRCKVGKLLAEHEVEDIACPRCGKPRDVHYVGKTATKTTT